VLSDPRQGDPTHPLILIAKRLPLHGVEQPEKTGKSREHAAAEAA
jgi:hypothetical protein